MGTHTIFESDFDCLTDNSMGSEIENQIMLEGQEKSLKARMLNEAEAFTLKNKKYASAADLMTSENSFLNCFRPKDFNLSSMTEILSQEPGEDIIEIVNLLASNRTDELRINNPKAAAKIDKLLQAIQRNSPVSPRNDQSSSNSSSFIPNSSVFAQINVSNDEKNYQPAISTNQSPINLSKSANSANGLSPISSLDSSQDSQKPLKGRKIAEQVIVPMLTSLMEEYKKTKVEPDIYCNVEKYAIDYGKTVEWFKKNIDCFWENLKSFEEEEDEDTEDDDDENSSEE